MSTFHNPNQKQNLNPYPFSSNQHPYPLKSPAPDSKLPTFDEVSKLFSLPLSDAADSLGISIGALRKICYENGLVRWPYRKIRAGKSIEEIKEEAAREKGKHVKDSSLAARQMNNSPATSALPSLFRASQVEDKSASSMQQLPKSAMMTQQQGNKNMLTANTQKSPVSNMPKGTSASLDEFKYGFPSEGLATVSYKWWGNSDSTGTEGDQKNGRKEIQGDNQTLTKPDASSVVSAENGQGATESRNLDSPGADSLSALRRRAVKEGQEALKLGIRRRFNLNKLDAKQKAVLLQVFKSSLPSQWMDESC